MYILYIIYNIYIYVRSKFSYNTKDIIHIIPYTVYIHANVYMYVCMDLSH